MRKLASIIIKHVTALCMASVIFLTAMEYKEPSSSRATSPTSIPFNDEKKIVQTLLSMQSLHTDADISAIESVPQEFIAKYRQLIFCHKDIITQAIDKLSPRTFSQLKNKLLDDTIISLSYQVSAERIAKNIAIAGLVQIHKNIGLAISKQKIINLLSTIDSQEFKAYAASTKASESFLLVSLLKEDGIADLANQLAQITTAIDKFEGCNSETLSMYLNQANAIKLLQDNSQDQHIMSDLINGIIRMTPFNMQVATNKIQEISEKYLSDLLESNPDTAVYADAMFH